MVALSQGRGIVGDAIVVHENQMVDIVCSVLITGRYAEINVTERLFVANGKVNRGGHGNAERTGIVAERKHYGADGRRKYRKFVRWNYV
jgi:hypothetical protein